MVALAGCGGRDQAGSRSGVESAAAADSVVGQRESFRRDILGSAIARGPAWVPGRALYTPEQALRGEDLFLTYCTACHGLDGMTSDALREDWTGRTVGDFYEYVRYAMPHDVPGRLSAEQNADLVAFLFRENGLPAGSEPFPAEDGALQDVFLTHPDSVSAGGGASAASP